MMQDDPFQGFEADIDYWNLPDETEEIPVPSRISLPEEEMQRRYILYAGMFDALVERLCSSSRSDVDLVRRLSEIRGRLRSLEPTLRFDLYEKRKQNDDQELVARMRGRGVAVTSEWMIPRLHRDIEIYRERIRSLERAFEELNLA
jgi:hypothetical protein